MSDSKYRDRSEQIWLRVMREGHSVEQVAKEFATTPARLERILRAIGRRRIAKSIYGADTRRLREHFVAERSANGSKD